MWRYRAGCVANRRRGPGRWSSPRPWLHRCLSASTCRAPERQDIFPQHAEKYLDVLALDRSKLKGIDATRDVVKTSAQDRAAYWQRIRLDNATWMKDWAPERGSKNSAAPKIISGASSLAFGT